MGRWGEGERDGLVAVAGGRVEYSHELREEGESAVFTGAAVMPDSRPCR